jgi:hypothetical protein
VENISFKALNPDNDVEVTQLTQLFTRVCGPSFPLTPVYQARFWKTHAGVRFTSLLALHGKKVLAHLGIRPDRDDSSTVQIYLPVCDPEFIEQHAELHQQMLDIVKRQAERQGWRVLYCYVLDDLAQMHFFANEVLHASEVAVWPACLPSLEIESQDPRRHVVVVQKVLQARPERTMLSLKGERDLLFVPEWHRPMCELVYASLGLKGAFASELECRADCEDEQRGATCSALPADRRAIETRTYRQTGITLSCVEPGLVPSQRRTVEQLLSLGAPYHYVALNLHHARTPSFCAELEEVGYNFCGLLPFLRGKDSIIYSNQKIDPLAMPSKSLVSSYALGRYLEAYNFADVEHALWEKESGRAGSITDRR